VVESGLSGGKDGVQKRSKKESSAVAGAEWCSLRAHSLRRGLVSTAAWTHRKVVSAIVRLNPSQLMDPFHFVYSASEAPNLETHRRHHPRLHWLGIMKMKVFYCCVSFTVIHVGKQRTSDCHETLEREGLTIWAGSPK
jgi:hypothetical protein